MQLIFTCYPRGAYGAITPCQQEKAGADTVNKVNSEKKSEFV